MASSELTLGKHSFALPHPDKLLFPRDALTKQDLVGYYRAVVHIMVPHLRGRPLMLARLPDGIQAGEERVFIDVQRNAYAQTSVAPYSVRSLPGAPVGTPLDWGELEVATPASFTVAGIPARLRSHHDRWDGISDCARPLGKVMQKFAKRSRAR